MLYKITVNLFYISKPVNSWRNSNELVSLWENKHKSYFKNKMYPYLVFYTDKNKDIIISS